MRKKLMKRFVGLRCWSRLVCVVVLLSAASCRTAGLLSGAPGQQQVLLLEIEDHQLTEVLGMIRSRGVRVLDFRVLWSAEGSPHLCRVVVKSDSEDLLETIRTSLGKLGAAEWQPLGSFSRSP